MAGVLTIVPHSSSGRRGRARDGVRNRPDGLRRDHCDPRRVCEAGQHPHLSILATLAHTSHHALLDLRSREGLGGEVRREARRGRFGVNSSVVALDFGGLWVRGMRQRGLVSEELVNVPQRRQQRRA